MGPKMQLPDNVIVHEPKEEAVPMMPPQEQEEYGGYTQEGGYCTSDSWAAGLVKKYGGFSKFEGTHFGFTPLLPPTPP